LPGGQPMPPPSSDGEGDGDGDDGDSVEVVSTAVGSPSSEQAASSVVARTRQAARRAVR